MAIRSLVVACALAGVAANAVDLTPDNYDELVTKSGKSAFIKFQAPW